MSIPPPLAADASADASLEAAAIRKITWRIMPFLFLVYVLSYLDRVNIGYAKLQFTGDLGLSNAAYGLGAGIFFFGYFVFEVPSNLLLKKFGARATIARITMLWGLLSCLMMFVRSETAFYVLRFLLGVAEAGLVPGVVLYLTFWFPSDRRARMVAVFMGRFRWQASWARRCRAFSCRRCTKRMACAAGSGCS